MASSASMVAPSSSTTVEPFSSSTMAASSSIMVAPSMMVAPSSSSDSELDMAVSLLLPLPLQYKAAFALQRVGHTKWVITEWLHQTCTTSSIPLWKTFEQALTFLHEDVTEQLTVMKDDVQHITIVNLLVI
ncbi:hypothetical protein QOT17_000012 [Balamuthia mandrillaris]